MHGRFRADVDITPNDASGLCRYGERSTGTVETSKFYDM